MKFLTILGVLSLLATISFSPQSKAATKRFDNAVTVTGSISSGTTILFEAAQKTEIKSIKLADTNSIAASATVFLDLQAERDGVSIGSKVDTIAGLAAYTALPLDLGTSLTLPFILEKGEFLGIKINAPGGAVGTETSILMNYRLIGNE